MQLIRSGHGFAALLGVALAMLAVTAMAQEIVVKPPHDAADIIRGHGGPDGLGAEHIRNYIGLVRAGARANALDPFLHADLNADGVVTKIEAQIYADSLAARTRARFGKLFEKADLDQNENLSAEEVATAGAAAAWNALDAEKEAALAGLLTLDSDGNGAVDMEELNRGLARANLVTKSSRKDDGA